MCVTFFKAILVKLSQHFKGISERKLYKANFEFAYHGQTLAVLRNEREENLKQVRVAFLTLEPRQKQKRMDGQGDGASKRRRRVRGGRGGGGGGGGDGLEGGDVVVVNKLKKV